MNKDQTLSHTTGRVSFKELQQIIKMGLVQGNLIPAFAGAWFAIVMTNHSFLSSIPQILLMLVGSTLIMGGACVLNNYYDQDIDRIMPSKQGRPTVNDRISDRNLLMLSFGMMLIGEACLFLLNIPSGVLGLIGIVDMYLTIQFGLSAIQLGILLLEVFLSCTTINWLGSYRWIIKFSSSSTLFSCLLLATYPFLRSSN